MRVATDSSNNSYNHYYYLTDHLGSVMAVTNDSGNKIGDVAGDNTNNNGLYRYDPYGNQLHNPLGSGVNNPIRWASGYFDADIGLYKFGTRYYWPGVAARWTQPDPQRGQLSNPMSLNPYLYGNSDPINNTDPTGEVAILAPLLIAGISRPTRPSCLHADE
jgi:RHS repeat-associated protein